MTIREMTVYESACKAGKYLMDTGRDWFSSLWREDPNYRSRRKVEMLEEMAAGASPVVRAQVAEYLGAINLDESRYILREMAEDDDPEVSAAARKALMMHGIFVDRPEDCDRC